MKKTGRSIALAVCAVLAGVVGWHNASRRYARSVPIPRAFAMERARVELAEAARIGIDSRPDESDTRVLPESSTPLSFLVPVEGRRCVAIVAAVYGQGTLSSIALTHFSNDGSTQILSQMHGSPRVAGQVQWCALEGGPASVTIDVDPPSVPNSSGETWVHVAIARGDWSRVGGPAALTRGDFDDSAMADLARADPDDAFEPRGEALDAGTPLGPAWLVAMGTALLVPSNGRTYDALYRANARDAGVAVNPRVVGIEPATIDAGAPRHAHAHAHAHAEVQAFDLAVEATRLQGPDGGPASPHDPVVDLGRNDFRRILAVVDPAAYAGRCARVVFTRGVPLLAAQVSAFDVQTWRVRAIARQANTAAETLCPAPAEPVIYVAPDNDEADYTVQLFVTP